MKPGNHYKCPEHNNFDVTAMVSNIRDPAKDRYQCKCDLAKMKFLDSIEFVWNMHTHGWESFWYDLMQHKVAKGDLNISMSKPQSSLAKKVKEVRNRPSTLSAIPSASNVSSKLGSAWQRMIQRTPKSGQIREL